MRNRKGWIQGAQSRNNAFPVYFYAFFSCTGREEHTQCCGWGFGWARQQGSHLHVAAKSPHFPVLHLALYHSQVWPSSTWHSIEWVRSWSRREKLNPFRFFLCSSSPDSGRSEKPMSLCEFCLSCCLKAIPMALTFAGLVLALTTFKPVCVNSINSKQGYYPLIFISDPGTASRREGFLLLWNCNFEITYLVGIGLDPDSWPWRDGLWLLMPRAWEKCFTTWDRVPKSRC